MNELVVFGFAILASAITVCTAKWLDYISFKQKAELQTKTAFFEKKLNVLDDYAKHLAFEYSGLIESEKLFVAYVEQFENKTFVDSFHERLKKRADASVNQSINLSNSAAIFIPELLMTPEEIEDDKTTLRLNDEIFRMRNGKGSNDEVKQKEELLLSYLSRDRKRIKEKITLISNHLSKYDSIK